jgi:hypothetical protein
MGGICWRRNALWLRILPLWLARPREGNTARYSPVAGHVSLFPLLYTAAEFPVKTVYTIFWLVLFLLVFDRLAPA